jgi:hypothetical protein
MRHFAVDSADGKADYASRLYVRTSLTDEQKLPLVGQPKDFLMCGAFALALLGAFATIIPSRRTDGEQRPLRHFGESR